MSNPIKAAEAIIQRVWKYPISGGAAANTVVPEMRPIVRQDVLAHDAYLDFGAPTGYRDEFKLPSIYHIGQNDFVHRRARKLREDPKNAPRN